MNLYFLLEGEKTEVQLYPAWIKFLKPQLQQVDFISQIDVNNFYIFSAGGIPSIYNHTVNAIKDINANPVFDKLVVCLDSEQMSVQDRIDELNSFIEDSGVKLNNKCDIKYIVHNICIESWFLGNRKIVKRQPQSLALRQFLTFYNVITDDPELMQMLEGYRNNADFHYHYLREILKEHGLSYSKSRPKEVLEESFLKELLNRIEQTNHPSSFKNFIDFMNEL